MNSFKYYSNLDSHPFTGDCADFYFKDDSGKEQYLADFFFEEVEDD